MKIKNLTFRIYLRELTLCTIVLFSSLIFAQNGLNNQDFNEINQSGSIVYSTYFTTSESELGYLKDKIDALSDIPSYDTAENKLSKAINSSNNKLGEEVETIRPDYMGFEYWQGSMIGLYSPWGITTQWGWYKNKSGDWIYNNGPRLSMVNNNYWLLNLLGINNWIGGGQLGLFPRWAQGFSCGNSFRCSWNQPGRDAYRYPNINSGLAGTTGNIIIVPEISNAAISKNYSTNKLITSRSITNTNKESKVSISSRRNSLSSTVTNRTTKRNSSPRTNEKRSIGKTNKTTIRNISIPRSSNPRTNIRSNISRSSNTSRSTGTVGSL